MFCTITPTRGDRPEFDEFCRWQLSRMRVKPDQSYFIDYKPKSTLKDLIERIQTGIKLARYDGFDRVYIIENDDWYSDNYFNGHEYHPGNFVGFSETIYYNIFTRRWKKTEHKHSSLFCTGFDISALDSFLWPPKNEPFLDVSLWNYARHKERTLKRLSDMPECIGIKHGIGLCGGKGHKMNLANSDKDTEWLKDRIDSTSFDFYKMIARGKK